MSCLQASLCVHHCHHLSYAGAHIILTLLKGPNYYQAGQGVGVARGTIITDSPLFFPLDFSVLYSPSTKQSPYCLPLWGYFPYITFLYASLGILPRRQAIHQTPTNSHLIVCLSGDTSPTPGHTPNTNKQSPYCMPLWGYFPDTRPYTGTPTRGNSGFAHYTQGTPTRGNSGFAHYTQGAPTRGNSGFAHYTQGTPTRILFHPFFF